MNRGEYLEIEVKHTLTGLERVLGLLRTQLLEAPRISLGWEGDHCLHVVLPVDRSRVPPDRLLAELSALGDVHHARRVPDADESVTVDMALARITASETEHWGGPVRVLSLHGDTAIVLVSGHPGEVDGVLSQLEAKGRLLQFVRAGRLVLDK